MSMRRMKKTHKYSLVIGRVRLHSSEEPEYMREIEGKAETNMVKMMMKKWMSNQ